MFKNKIALKLSLYFAVALMVFSVIIGSVFMFLFKSHTIDLHKMELEKRATKIADTMSKFMPGKVYHGGQGGYGAYMRLIGDIAGTDVWIIDRDLNLITANMMGNVYKYNSLPPNADNLIRDVFDDKTVFSEGFSDVLSELTLTVGAPIKTVNDEVVGVVLLHSPVHGVNEAVYQGFITLSISILVALIIAFLLSVSFSITFTKPLKKMEETALRLASGDYTSKNNIKQKDEIGHLSDTIDSLSDKLDYANKQSIKLEQMRKDFVANISHELRTPITVMRGSLEALIEKVITNPVQVESYHKQMLNETLFLQRLVGDLLDLSRLQNMDFAIMKDEISICDVIDDATKSASQIADKKGIRIIIQKDVEYCLIHGDYSRLRQMMIIVLDNAVKFSPPNSNVEVTLQNKILSIRDFGSGISKDDLPYIFDRFYKSRSEQNKTGTGLGLAIAKQIADRHNIKLTAESNDTNGTCFNFQL